jgi:hypothetical protein
MSDFNERVTRIVSLHMKHDRGLWLWAEDVVRSAALHHRGEGEAAIVNHAAIELGLLIEDLYPMEEGMHLDLMQAALDYVNWTEIAQNMIDNIDWNIEQEDAA